MTTWQAFKFAEYIVHGPEAKSLERWYCCFVNQRSLLFTQTRHCTLTLHLYYTTSSCNLFNVIFTKLNALRIHWKLSTILETRNISVWSNVFWYVKVCTFWKCIQYSIHWDETQILKRLPLDKIKGTKNALFSFASSNSLQFNF